MQYQSKGQNYSQSKIFLGSTQAKLIILKKATLHVFLIFNSVGDLERIIFLQRYSTYYRCTTLQTTLFKVMTLQNAFLVRGWKSKQKLNRVIGRQTCFFPVL